LKEAYLIIIDEASALTKFMLDAIDYLLKDIMYSKKTFGGKIILLGGDFRQCLPVIRHGRKLDILESTIKYSDNWKYFHTYLLTKNKRS
jgi:hypothetical protein